MFGRTAVVASLVPWSMFNVGSRPADDPVFDTFDTFDPQHLPGVGPFLDGCDVLEGDEHAAFHRLTRWVFEDRGVYDVTFGYNLARLNLDRRHDDAGFRYAAEPNPADAPAQDSETSVASAGSERQVLHAEFTPTTEFCPQSEQLTKGAFRAWNGLSDRHEYDLVKVRVHPMHQRNVEINAELEALELAFIEDGSLTLPDATASGSHDGDELGDSVDDDIGTADDLPF